jgi:hypothetical protein
MTSRSAPAKPVTEFYDAVIPALKAGSYLLSVEQSVDVHGVKEVYRNEQPIRVTGPHFGLPAGSVFGMNPPAGGTADYRNSLPSIVLSEAALPWTIDPGGGGGGQRPTWTALLLLRTDEIRTPERSGEASLAGSHTVSLADYLVPPAGLVGPAFTEAQRERFRQENPTDRTVTVVDVDAEAFWATAPRVGELALLAHAREVDPAELAETDAATGTTVSVVLGNRLIGEGVYAAHLVSVEGFTSYLTPHDGPGAVPGQAVRLLSLASWTFTSVPGASDFPAAMRALQVGLLALPETFREPRDEGERIVARTTALGYAAAEYRTRLGERTVAWYRGPCLPIRMKRNRQPLYPASDAALIYDPHSGMFDVSFAVAWQTGRLAALADRALVTDLLRWMRSCQRAGHLMLERDSLRRSLGLSEETGNSGPRTDEPAARTVSGLARTAVAAALASVTSDRAGVRTLAPPTDPTGLLAHLDKLPGLLHPDEPFGPADAGDPTASAIAAARRRAGA